MITAVIAVKLIPLWSSIGVEDSLYDEVVPSSSDNTPLSNNELLVLFFCGGFRICAVSSITSFHCPSKSSEIW